MWMNNKPGGANSCVRDGSVYDHNAFPTLFGVFQRFCQTANGQRDIRTYEHTDGHTDGRTDPLTEMRLMMICLMSQQFSKL